MQGRNPGEALQTLTQFHWDCPTAAWPSGFSMSTKGYWIDSQPNAINFLKQIISTLTLTPWIPHTCPPNRANPKHQALG